MKASRSRQSCLASFAAIAATIALSSHPAIASDGAGKDKVASPPGDAKSVATATGSSKVAKMTRVTEAKFTSYQWVIDSDETGMMKLKVGENTTEIPILVITGVDPNSTAGEKIRCRIRLGEGLSPGAIKNSKISIRSGTLSQTMKVSLDDGKVPTRATLHLKKGAHMPVLYLDQPLDEKKVASKPAGKAGTTKK